MIEKQFEQLRTEALEINDCERLLQDIRCAKSLLYLGDNCGEICLDKILVKKLKKINPSCEIYFATRGAAVVNDSIEEDAYFVGMDQFATIISNGDYSLGTVLSRTSEELLEYTKMQILLLQRGRQITNA